MLKNYRINFFKALRTFINIDKLIFFMNLNKMFENKIKQYIKIIHHDQVEFIPGMCG